MCLHVSSQVGVQLSRKRTRLGLGLALSLTTRETVGKSLHFCASLHLQGISSTQNGSKHPGLKFLNWETYEKYFFPFIIKISLIESPGSEHIFIVTMYTSNF